MRLERLHRCASYPLGWVAALWLALIASAPEAVAQRSQNLGVVRPHEFAPIPIAVPPFEAVGDKQFETPVVSRIINNDLKLSGFFRPPSNANFVQEVHEQDVRAKKIHFADWARIGVAYLVKGQYRIKGDRVEVEFRTYDTSEGAYMFGKKYPMKNYKLTDLRSVAHYVSDDITERITSFPGTAHTKIVYVGQSSDTRGQQTKEIFVMDADGHGVRRLTYDYNLAATPTWGARATEIYYTTYKDFNPDLAGVFLDGSYWWFVSRQPNFNLSPDWAPKRSRLTLTLTKDGNSEIYLMDRQGKGLKRLTYSRFIESSPAWSPSGDQIAFTSDRTGTKQIYLMDDTGINVRRVTRAGAYNDGAAWTPSGDRIAYASRIDGVFQICTTSPTGEDYQQLTYGNFNCEAPSWSPNGWVIAYTSERGGRKHIETIFADGRSIAQLTKGSESYSCDWSPLLP